MGMFNKLTDHCKLVNNGEIDYYIIDRMDEVKAEMLRLLRIIDNICRDKELKYWIDGGTLIGAVRHKGFIPWDDDIDISLLKPDYNILIKELESGNYSDERKEWLWFSGNNRYEHCCNYLCSHLNIYGRMKGSFGVVPIKLDIRPVNVIRNDKDNLDLNTELREIANEWIFNKKVKNLTKKSKRFQEMTKTEFLRFYNDEYGFVKDDNSVLALPYYEFANEGFLPKHIFDKVIEWQFDTITTFIPAKYDEYLKMFYGDFMQLPPVENRVPAQYEYIELNSKSSFIHKTIRQPSTNHIVSLFRYIKLFGIQKICAILKEKSV
ncbi:phosphorylcholine transferase LicD [Muribaculum sp.]|uniref:LicD family protein n=1 Tax=Muribaculum sp. TaxID=1918611 RepID=UPI00258B1BF8|nr:LicD family protein [Muribaculum sp.]MCX4276455.1 LicD family protein [Muribaculum sp.]